MEYFEPFEKVIAREDNEDCWSLDFFQFTKTVTSTNPSGVKVEECYYNGIFNIYTQMHKYEPWMRQFINTSIPFEKWKEQNY